MDIVRKICLPLALFTILSVSFLQAEILSPAEQHQLVQMLNSADFDSTDVNFLKDWDPTTKFKLPCQVVALNNPWEFIRVLDYLKDKIEKYSSAQYPSSSGEYNHTDYHGTFLHDMLKCLFLKCDDFNEYDSEVSVCGNPLHFSGSFYKPVNTTKQLFSNAEFIFDFCYRYNKTQREQEDYLEKLDSLNCFLYQLWQESDDSLEYKPFYKTNFPDIKTNISTEDGVKLLRDINYDMERWMIFQALCRIYEKQVKEFDFTNKKPIYHKSKYGTMIIGGTGNDNYNNSKRLLQSPPCLIIEPGGNDVYECALYADNKHPFYIVIDQKGDDVYRNKDIGRELSVLNGYGYLHDFEGDDLYSGGDFSLSARYGYQANIDDKGNDTYIGGLFTQGAAMFGVSILQDNAGNDTYTATEFAQGMGGTKGLGLLLDGKGNDVYYTGGKYLHTPLAPFDYRSMAQGFGFGMRPDLAGGIGILYDGEGNDRYSGGVYAQGVAYWYAIGALFDEKGNDYYDAVYYPQGSGIHLANGALIDMEGEDHYYSKHGPGQGNGHDWSVGVFVDKKGNDEYSIEGGNGLGLTNSVGIFVDSEGNDSYEKRSTSNYGYANAARETAGLGLFLDGGGKDSYPDSTKADNKTWQQGTYGIGQDLELNIAPQTKMEELAEQSTADVDSLASIDKLFAMAAEWEVGSATKSVKLAREYLLKRDKEAVPYVLKEKMATDSGLEYRALEELTKQSKLMQTSLYAVLHDADSLKVKNAMALISGTKDSLAVDSISVFLKQNMYIPASLSCLGSFKTTKALDLIRPWLTHHTEKYRYLATRSLKAMNTPEAIAELRKMSGDSSFLIKAMVRQLPQGDKVIK